MTRHSKRDCFGLTNMRGGTAERFRRQRYLVVRRLLPRAMVEYLKAYYEVLRVNDSFGADEQCPRSWSLGGDPGLDAVLEWIRPEISRRVGLDLAPTYSYTRRYARGERLDRHRDRAACEISVTVCIDTPKDAGPSTLFVKAPAAAARKIDMWEGDGCVYAGTEVEHWREKFRADGYIQLFLHFIDRRGRFYPKWLFDRRRCLGAPYQRRKRRDIKRPTRKATT
jgi:hypothetical protein